MATTATRSGCLGGRNATGRTYRPRGVPAESPHRRPVGRARPGLCTPCHVVRHDGHYRVAMARSLVSDLAGRVLAGRYLLHSAIGTGSSGRVYLAEDTRLRRRVAVKILHAALADDTAFLRRFRAEAQVAASLHHPHIVTVHDWGEDDVPFMVLELLEGGSLRSHPRPRHASLRPAGRARRPRRRRRARVRARARHPAPRHQAREPALRRARHRPRRRLRPRARPRRGELDRTVGRRVRHGAVRVTRAGDWACSSTPAPTSTRWRSSSSSRSPDACRSPPTRPIGMLDRAHAAFAHRAGGGRAARADRRTRGPDRRERALPGRGDHARRARRRRRVAAAAGAVAARGHDRRTRPAPDAHGRARGHRRALRPGRGRRRDRRARSSRRITAEARLAPARPLLRRRRAGPRDRGRRRRVRQRRRRHAGRGPGPRRLHRRGRDRAGGRGRDSTSTSPSEEHAPDPAGTIISQSPESGTFTDGKTVKVVVSSGPAPIAVPDVVNQPQADAENALRGAGFVLGAPKTEFSRHRRERHRDGRRSRRAAPKCHPSRRSR